MIDERQRELVCACGWRRPWDWKEARTQHVLDHHDNGTEPIFHVEIDGHAIDRPKERA